MSCTALLNRLDKVRQTAPDRWIACCPAHKDKSPSLSIRISDSDKLLVHCLAGCDTGSVLDAVGLTFSDLFPDRPTDHRTKPSRSTIPAADLLVMVDEEVTAAAIAAAAFLESRELTADDWDRLSAAARRLGFAAAEVRRQHPWRPSSGR